MVRHYGMKGQKRKKRGEKYDREEAEQESKYDREEVEEESIATAKRAMIAKDDEKKTEEEEEVDVPELEGIPIAPSDQKTTKPGVIFILETASLEVAKVGKTYQLLNSDDHSNSLRKNNKNPADYRPDIAHQALLAILDSTITKAGRLKALYVRTEKGVLFEVKPHVRIPRTPKRFAGLMSLSMQEGTRLSKNDETLRVLHEFRKTFEAQMKEVQKEISTTNSQLQQCMGVVDVRLEAVEAQLQHLRDHGVLEPTRTNVEQAHPTGSTHQFQDSLGFNPQRSMKLDASKFDGIDVQSWVFRIQRFFNFYNIPDEQRLEISSFHLEGTALFWFQWMQTNSLISTWKEFLEAVMQCFGPSLYEDPKGELAKLHQHSKVAVYQAEFEHLSSKATGFSESCLVSFFISGLQQDLKRELLVAQPKNLIQAMSLAKIFDSTQVCEWLIVLQKQIEDTL